MVSLRSGKRVAEDDQIDAKTAAPKTKKVKTSNLKSSESAKSSNKEIKATNKKETVLQPISNLQKAINSVKSESNTPTKESGVEEGSGTGERRTSSKATKPTPPSKAKPQAESDKTPSKRTPSSATKAEAKTDKTPTKTDRTVQSKSDKKEASTKKKDSERPSTPPPACEVIDGVEKTPGLVGPIRPQVIGAGSDIKIAPFKGPKGNKVRKSFQEKEDEYGQEILKRPDHAFHELHVCYQKGPKGSPTYDKAGFELDYKEVAKWMAPKAYDKSAMMRAMDRAIESSEKKEEAMKRIFFEPGAAPVEGPESFRDVGFWVDRVSKDLNVPWHRVGVKEFEIWEKKGFRKAKRGEFAYANATMEEKERISRLGEGRYLRK
ncbi:hypothetical protein GLAREA_12593 [Glarea lozoyensis ATCC 20868]|uniref:Uncharacterized protein n=1 Tax=Glarea lozoyensis (strain ATCC 20868 / MF5171) TaxID=1116229 RepID=S3D0D6_GLAL2|nr:uncharacterized protein GLAREA_12593 [Glarea lozoyensis ATCC 20868]EPE31290.1 hypothetical protein GLAREA_12593 [Glarea lozoyensis ATCC 20868]